MAKRLLTVHDDAVYAALRKKCETEPKGQRSMQYQVDRMIRAYVGMPLPAEAPPAPEPEAPTPTVMRAQPGSPIARGAITLTKIVEDPVKKEELQ